VLTHKHVKGKKVAHLSDLFAIWIYERTITTELKYLHSNSINKKYKMALKGG
jgi:hypothetical protein